jgi:DNA-binding GntR family transcriptional regulator
MGLLAIIGSRIHYTDSIYSIINPMRRIKRQPAVTDRVLDEVRRVILSGALPPGAKVTQEQLADQLAVSRAPVRQALLILEREGLVRSDGWQGAVVTPLDPSLIRDTYQFRGEVERFAASDLAARFDFDVAPLRAITAEGHQAAPTGDVLELIDVDLRFHTGLYDAVGNHVLSEVMRGQWNHIRRVMGATLSLTGYSSHVWDEHDAILDAIAAHNAELAGTLARNHTSAACAALLPTLVQQTAAPESPTSITRSTLIGRRKRRIG